MITLASAASTPDALPAAPDLGTVAGSGLSMTPTPAPLTAGIPQSSAPPESPWLAKDRETLEATRKRAYAQQQRVDGALLDPTAFFKDTALPTQFVGDLETVKRRSLVKLYLTHANNGHPIPMGADGHDLLRARVAGMKGWGGKAAADDNEFLARATTEAQGRKDTRDLIEGTDEATRATSLSGRLTTAAMEGKGWQGAFLEWQKGAATDPRFDRSRLAEYEDQAEQAHARISERFETARPFADAALDALNAEKENSGGYGGKATVDAILAAPADLRPTVIALLASQATKQGDQQEKGGHLIQTFARGMARQMVLGPSSTFEARTLIAAEKALAKMKPGDEFGGLYRSLPDAVRGDLASSSEGEILGRILEPFIKNNVATAESIAAAKQEIARQKDAFQLSKQLEQIGQGMLDPLKADGWISEKILYPFTASVAPSIASFTATRSVTGSSLGAVVPMWGMMANDTAQQYLSENPGMSFEMAYDLGAKAAYTMSALEYAETALTLGSTRLLGNALKTAQASAYKTFARSLVTNLVAQNTLEGVQDMTPYVVQALSRTAPDVQWDSVLNGENGYWKQRADTFWAILPAVVMGAGSSTIRAKASRADLEKAAAALQDEQQTKAAGILPADRSALAAETDAATRLNLFQQALKRADPTIAKEGQAELDALRQQQERAIQEGQALGILPTITRTTDGQWIVRDTETGEDIGTAPDTAGAWKLAQAHSATLRELDSDRVAYMATMLEGAEAAGKLDPKASFELDLGTLMTAATLDPAAAARFARQTRVRELARGGTGVMAEIIHGRSITDFARGQRETVNKIYRGADIRTVFHEWGHGKFRAALDSGAITLAEALGFLRSVDQVLTGKKTRGESLAILPADFDSLTPEDQQSAIDEGFSEVMEMEILRTRSKGRSAKAKPVPVASGIITRNLSAIASLAPGATEKVSAFIEAARDFFGLTLARAVALKKAERDGLFDAAGYEAFLAKSVGLDLQDEHDAATGERVKDLLGDDAPFSLGSSKIADLMAGNALARVKDPIRRAQAMSKISRSFNELRIQWERLELLSGANRLKKSLRKEAAMREAQRADELERAAYARHWGVLSNEDLVKIKSQPGHAFLASPDSHLHGRLMSKSAAIAKHPDLFQVHRAGDYDGADGVSRSLFGGQLMPDQAAQEMFDAHLIKEPTPDAMWALLLKEQEAVAGMKEMLAKAKEDIRNARTQAREEVNAWLEQETGNVREATKENTRREIMQALQSLDAILAALPPDVRGRIGGYTTIARITNEDSRLEYLREKLEAADKELEKWMRRQYDTEFRELLKRTKPQKDEAGQKPRGTIGADVHDLFRAVEAAMPLTGPEVEAEVFRLESLAGNVATSPEDEAHLTLQAGLVSLAGNWRQADAARREAALLEATRLFSTGYLQYQIEASAKREARRGQRDSLRSDTGSAGARMERVNRSIKDKKTKLGRAKQTVLSLFSFEQLTHVIFGEDSTIGRTLVEWERRASEAKEDGIQSKVDALQAVFTGLTGSEYKGEQLRWKMAEPGTITVKDWQGNEQSFSELEAISMTLMWRQEDGQRHMKGHLDDSGNPAGSWHWRQEDIDAVEDQLSKEAKIVRLHLTDRYGSEYDRINSVFVQLYGVNMPRHKNYSPLTVKPAQAGAAQTLDPVTGSAMSGPSLTPGSLRNRSQTAIAEPDFKDALQVYIAHAKQMEHWMAYTPFATEAMALFNNREVGNSIEAAAGHEAKAVLRGWIDYFAQGGTRDAAAHLAVNGLLGRMLNRASAAALVGRVSVLGIQSLQLGAASYEMPTGAYIKGLARLTTGQLGWISTIRSEYIQRRLQQMPPVVRQAMEGLTSSKPSRMKFAAQKMGRLISGADALFTAGTYAIVHDWQLSLAKQQGLTGPEADRFAHDAASRITDRVAQPIRPGARSLYEVTATSPQARMLWAFASEARQKAAITAYALSEKPWDQKIKTLAITWLVSGVGASVLRAAMSDLRDDGEDDEIFDERNWNPLKLALQSLTGPLQGIPILGKEIQSGINAAFGQWQTDGSLISGGRRVFQRGRQVARNGYDDWEDAFKDAEMLLTAFAPFSDSASAATSFAHLLKDLHAVIDNAIPD